MVDKIDARAHELAPLAVGDRVRVQNQAGTAKTRWSRTGTVIEINNEFDQYLVRMDGSRRTTARNRQFLRKIRADTEGRRPAEKSTTTAEPAATGKPRPATEARTPPRDRVEDQAPATPPRAASTPATEAQGALPGAPRGARPAERWFTLVAGK